MTERLKPIPDTAPTALAAASRLIIAGMMIKQGVNEVLVRLDDVPDELEIALAGCSTHLRVILVPEGQSGTEEDYEKLVRPVVGLEELNP